MSGGGDAELRTFAEKGIWIALAKRVLCRDGEDSHREVREWEGKYNACKVHENML